MSNRSIVRSRGQSVPANGDGAAAPVLGPDFVLPRGAGSDEEGDLQRYWQLIYSRRWFLLAAALLGLAVAAFITFRQPRLYVAQATVEFKKATPPGKALNLDLLGRSAPIPPLLATRLLTTKILAARIIKAERIRGVDWFDPPATGDAPRSILAAAWDGAWSAVASGASAVRLMLAPKPRHPAVAAKRPRTTTWDGVTLDTINRYYATVAVTPVRGTSLADIKVTNPDPEVAARVANLHAQTFIDMDVETKIASLSDTQGLLGRQLKEVRQQLEASRRALTDYQLKHGIFNLPKETGTLSRQSLQQLNTLFTKAQGERILAEAAYRNAASLKPADLAATLPNKGLQTLRERLLSLEGQYQANLKDFGPRHPDMITMRARIAALHGQLNKAAMQARKRLRAVFTAARTKESALRHDLKKLSRSASQEDRELVQLSIYQRDAESNAQLYANLLDQVKEVNLVGASQWTNVKLVDRAVAPTVPSFPKTKRNLLLGMMLGLIGAGLGCLLIERLDTTINTPDDLVTWLDLPAFGVIPDFRRLSTARVYGQPAVETEELTGTRHDLVTLLHPASLVSEAYRAVRTNLMFSSPDSPPKSVLITSSQAGEGKTVTVINLAVTLTLSGARVLVVDGDLRNPTCHAALRVKRAPGLSNVLTGQTALDDVVVRSPLCPVLRNSDNGFGLYVLPAGRVPPNPAELLASQRMTTLLATLKEHFDFVLVDSPPIIPVTDSVVMATKVDGVLMVIRGGEWRRDLVRKALWQLDTVHSHVLGGVLNSVNINRGAHSYYYYQQYHGYRSAYGRPYGQAYGQAPETDDEAAT